MIVDSLSLFLVMHSTDHFAKARYFFWLNFIPTEHDHFLSSPCVTSAVLSLPQTSPMISNLLNWQ
jgi:hypothetical protein